jgi:tetratricopeptide (TPR) repeat protein
MMHIFSRGVLAVIFAFASTHCFAQSKKELLANGIEAYERGAYQQCVDDLSVYLEKSDKDSTAFYYRGMAYAKLQNYAGAQSDYSKAVVIGPRYFEAFKERGNIYAMRGQLDLARTDFNAAIFIQPNYADAYYNRALVCLQQQNFRGAVDGRQYRSSRSAILTVRHTLLQQKQPKNHA